MYFIMRSNWFKYLISFILLVFYINRGLFVAPGFEVSNSSGNEINSLLEVIINWAGGYNDVDEDGDCSETYDTARTAQFLSDQNLNYSTCLTHPFAMVHKLFSPDDEAMITSGFYGTIDQPPELLKIDY